MAAADDILEFLRGNPEEYYSRKEISKRACHREVFDENPHWAVHPLHALVEQGQIEQSDAGHYRMKQTGYKSKREKDY